MVLQLTLNHIIDRYASDHLNYDDPIVFSIVDTSNPYPWLRNNSSNDEWKEISDKSNSKRNDVNGVEVLTWARLV
ncbi:11551_t:CDS:2 [Entrophospora sp. SA101]|nr:11551_t:CDS:2 [Entrophospora sp. SA101]CAJ0866399.1 3613_t:CDS:2 [Entrophospora sp. SA101]CAJ0922749.1 3176_t:CDS:2 [Entrophospora sp. SA101]CAJ0922755.1 3179_t:CDS:2 [Entrophospora sp. SA101]